MEKSKYVVLIPYLGNRWPSHVKCMNQLMMQGTVIIEQTDCTYLDMAQACLVERALETKAEVFMFIEHDMTFNPADVEGMIQRLLDSEYDALGAFYSLKRFGIRQYIGVLENPTGEVVFYQPGLHRAEFLGFGFTAIRRRVFEQLATELPYVSCEPVGRAVHPFFQHSIESFRGRHEVKYHGNDMAFYNRMHKAGFKIGADLQVRAGHLGSHEYQLEDASFDLARYAGLKVVYTKPVL